MNNENNRSSWLDYPILAKIYLNWETILFFSILVLGVISRFYILGARVMSHDETSHVYFSWRLFKGFGYQHDPVTHGPFQFHILALFYFLFGDNDFTARAPAALFGIAVIGFMWFYRRYLGRTGAIVAAFLLLISPYMLYYARYARNEAFVALFGVMMVWGMLRYMETGTLKYSLWVTIAMVMHICSKETAYIYIAQALLFLAFYFIIRVVQKPWPKPEFRKLFLMALILGIVLLAGAGAVGFLSKNTATISPTETSQPAIPGQTSAGSALTAGVSPVLVLEILAFAVLIASLVLLIKGYSLTLIRSERSFDLLMLIGTLILPLLTAFPVKILGWNPTDYSSSGMLHTAIILVPLLVISVLLGLWWNWRTWLWNAAIYWAIFTVFYTTLFTNGSGFFTGMVGSLGYWLEQQGVNRGSQPWYYYLFIQIPIYEYLPAIGTLLALGIALIKKQISIFKPETPINLEQSTEDLEISSVTPPITDEGNVQNGRSLAITLLGFWAITSALAYTVAGEKMPWLTVHITWPMILLTGWVIGYIIDSIDWNAFKQRRGFVILLLMPVFLLSLVASLSSVFGANPPFKGKDLAQLQATSTFLIAFLTLIASVWGLVYLVKSWRSPQFLRVLTLTIFGLFAILTARSAFQASYINYDNATEYLVYAHSGPGNKLVLSQIEELSRRTSDGLAMPIAYDNSTTYPFWWYLRNYTDQRYFGSTPTRELRDDPVILVGSENYGKVEPIVGQAFYKFSYIRMWWPNQDYFDLTWARVINAINSPQWRSAIIKIWMNRDYTEYGKLVNRDMSLPKWQPSDEMRLYVRKDIAAQLWKYGVGPSADQVVADPYEGKQTKLSADLTIGSEGVAPGQFNRPRGLVVAPDGTLYVADTGNNRIQHLDRSGNVIQTWGTFADLSQGTAEGGTFFEPWGIAVSPDGAFVFVADTWNHRIQKFSSSGEFIKMWGYFGQAEKPEAFWGPRDVAINSQNQLFVTDTGNKRIVIFDLDGNYINQFGTAGFGLGQFDEPVGLALDKQDRLYVADTWNQRIQVFTPDSTGSYTPLTSWEMYAWFGNSLDNKPYMAVDGNGHVFTTDPEGNRVLEFTSDGAIVRYWGDFGNGLDTFNITGVVTIDPSGGVWVSDVGNARVMHFNIPVP